MFQTECAEKAPNRIHFSTFLYLRSLFIAADTISFDWGTGRDALKQTKNETISAELAENAVEIFMA